jgi:hypothetical protein
VRALANGLARRAESVTQGADQPVDDLAAIAVTSGPGRPVRPASIIAGARSAVLTLYSLLWIPRFIESDADHYGIIGVMLAMLMRQIVVCFCVVVSDVICTEMGGASRIGADDTVRPPHRSVWAGEHRRAGCVAREDDEEAVLNLEP